MNTASADQYIPSPCSIVSSWVHKNISIDNIIIVENDGCIHRLLSDFEYAKVMSNESPNPKTVCFDIKNRIFLIFDQDMLYFMPFKIHSGEKIIPSASTQFLSDNEFAKFWSSLSQIPGMLKAILRYTPNYD